MAWRLRAICLCGKGATTTWSKARQPCCVANSVHGSFQALLHRIDEQNTTLTANGTVIPGDLRPAPYSVDYTKLRHPECL